MSFCDANISSIFSFLPTKIKKREEKKSLYQLSKESFFSLALQGSELDSNFQVFFPLQAESSF